MGQAFSFDGVDDYVEVPSTENLDITGVISLAAWIKTSGTNDYSGIVGKIHNRDPATGYLTGVDPDSKLSCNIIKTRVLLSEGWTDGGTAVSTTSVEDGSWHHVVCTYDGAKVKVYVDGRFEAETSNTDGIASNDEPLQIGFDPFVVQDRHFSGLIDEVRIYNRALSDAEIKAIYDAGIAAMAGGTFPDDPAGFLAAASAVGSLTTIDFEMLPNGLRLGERDGLKGHEFPAFAANWSAFDPRDNFSGVVIHAFKGML